MILIVVPTKNGSELVNFANVHCTYTTPDGVRLNFGADACLTTTMTKEELIHEVLSAINRDKMPLFNHKNILIKQLKGTNEDQY